MQVGTMFNSRRERIQKNRFLGRTGICRFEPDLVEMSRIPNRRRQAERIKLTERVSELARPHDTKIQNMNPETGNLSLSTEKPV